MQKMINRFAPLFRHTNTVFNHLGRPSHWKYSKQSFGRAVIPSMLATGYALYFPAHINLQENDKKE